MSGDDVLGEGLLRTLLDATWDGVLVVSSDGVVLHGNAPALAMLGDDVVGIDLRERIHPADVQLATDTFVRGLVEGPEGWLPVSCRMLGADHVWCHIEGRIAGEVEFGGVDDAQIVVVRDVSTRVARETAIQEAHRRLEAVVENIDDVIVILDPSLDVQWTSPGIERFIDAPAYTNLGENAFNDMHPDDVPEVEATLGKVLADDAGRGSVTFRLNHARHGWRWVECSLVNRVHDPAIGGLVCTLHDATDRVGIGADTDGSVLHDREEMARLREADRIKDAFLATVSHELRTPLTAVRGFTAVLASQDLDEETRRQLVQRISVNARDMEDMISQLLDFSRLEAGRVSVELVPLDLARAVDEMLDRLDHVLQEHEVVVDIGASSALADRAAFSHVMRNLLTNAVRYSDAGSRIEVRTRREGGEVCIEVSDQGIGIAQEDQARVFQSFYQASPSAAGRRGTGIGLNVARRFAQLQGGLLHLESEPGVGSTFTLRLRAPD